MRFRRPRLMVSERLATCRLSSPQAAPRSSGSLPACCAALAAGLLALAAGCGSPGSTAAKTAGTPGTGTPCGMTRTAANVPVNIQVAHGQVSCATAMTVEKDYASYIASGKAPGNGGGGPVHILGWTCQGFPTPVVLKTGQASKCVDGGVEILAILPAPA